MFFLRVLLITEISMIAKWNYLCVIQKNKQVLVKHFDGLHDFWKTCSQHHLDFFFLSWFFFVFPLCYFLLLLFVPRRDAEDIKELFGIEFISRVQSEVRKRLTERKKRREWNGRRRRTAERNKVTLWVTLISSIPKCWFW